MTWRHVAVTSVVVVLLIALATWVAGVRGLSFIIARPAQIVSESTLKVRSFFQAIKDIQTLRQRVASLETENHALQAELAMSEEAKVVALARERQIITAPEPVQSHAVPARVASRSPSRLADGILVDKGSSVGVANGQAVLSDGFLVGVVHETSAQYSQIQLLSNAALQLPVTLQKSRAQGILHGGLSGLMVSDIPADVSVTPGEVVVTSALGGVIRPGIPVGSVERVLSSTSEVLQQLLLRSPIQFSALEFVAIDTENISEGQ